MPAIRSVVVHVSDEGVSRHAFALATALALDLGAQVTAVLAGPAVHAGIGLSPETASLAAQLRQAQQDALRQAGERFASEARTRGVEIELQPADSDAVDVLLRHSRAADLLITTQHDPIQRGGLSAGPSTRLILGSSCPVLTVPSAGLTFAPAGQQPLAPLQRALVAWSDTRESARALRDALPLLARATQVDLVRFTHAGGQGAAEQLASLEQVSAWLGRHGVRAKASLQHMPDDKAMAGTWRSTAPDLAVAEALLSHAADLQADFVVMGCYGHSRLWELVLGGVTRTMLETMTVPVLMSH